MTGPLTNERARGFSLLEVLVALVILSVGLLGLAALQARSLQFNQDAYVRTQATLLAYDIIDRMRANNDDALDYTNTATPVAGRACANANDGSRPCDLLTWHNAVANRLPAGAGCIKAIDAGGGVAPVYTVAGGFTTCADAAPTNGVMQVVVGWADRSVLPPQPVTQSWTFRP